MCLKRVLKDLAISISPTVTSTTKCHIVVLSESVEGPGEREAAGDPCPARDPPGGSVTVHLQLVPYRVRGQHPHGDLPPHLGLLLVRGEQGIYDLLCCSKVFMIYRVGLLYP